MSFFIKPAVLYFLIAVYTAAFPQHENYMRKVSFDCKEMPLPAVIKLLCEKTGISFIYNDNLLSNDKKISCNFKNAVIEDILGKIFAETDISYKIFGSNSVVLFKDKKISGPKYNTEVIPQRAAPPDSVHRFLGPKIIYEGDPKYPLEAVINNIEGKVTLKLYINKDGKIAKANIEHSSKSTVLDSAALKYAYTLKFAPANADGNPISSWYLITFLYSVIGQK